MGSAEKLGELNSSMTSVIESVLRADFAVLSVLKDSSVRSYSPGSRPVESILTLVPLNSSSSETKERA